MSLVNGRHLRAGRILAGMTQRDLAEAAGLHVNSVKYHEQRDGRIEGDAVAKMLAALDEAGITVAEEFSGGRCRAVLRG